MTVTVRIEVPRGGFVKPAADGTVDFRSPLPAPFNYGCVPDRPGGDGDPLDAVVLGARRAAGTDVDTRVWRVVRFLDAGRVDDKLVCADHPPTRWELAVVVTFFRAYGVAKTLLNRSRGRAGPTRFVGMELVP